MFNDSKYTNWYYAIIENAKIKNINDDITHYEKHHIIPVSLGGNNDKNNIVKLTYREHFLCHWLLIKMTSKVDKMKMSFALYRMGKPSNANHRIVTSWQYELSREYNKKERNEYKLRTVNKGKITVKDNNGNIFHITKDDPRWNNGEVEHVTKGLKRNWSDTEKKEIYKSRKGRKYTEEEHIKRAATRKPIWNKGIKTGKQSNEHLESRIKNMRNKTQQTIECPHCKKVGGVGSMYRWHFDNCKVKEIN
jgi:hypothetical protein